MNLQDFLQRFPDAKRSGNNWSATCPAHADHNASLSIGEADDGKLLVRCHAGCPTQTVVEAVGLQMRDLFPDNGRSARPAPAGRGRGRITATYDYHSKDGTPLIRVVRYEPKSFSRQRPDGHGGWAFGGTSDVAALYRWPELARACAEHGTAYLVEGEKDVDALTRLGITATTCLGGASKWRDEYSDEFVGLRKLIIIADRDSEHNKFAGQRFADRASKAIRAKGVEVRTLCLPAEIDGDMIKDTSDFLQHGRGLAELERAVADAPAWEEYFASIVPPEAADQSLMDSVWAGVADREHPQTSEIVGAISGWLDAHGRFFNVDGQLRYCFREENRFFDTLSREWLAWLFRRLPAFGQTDKFGREITASFSKTPLALDAPSTEKVEARHFWDATGDAVYISCGPDAMYRVTASAIDRLSLGEDGIFLLSTLEPWTFLADDPGSDPLNLPVFKGMACSEAQKRLIMLWAYALPFNQKCRPLLLLQGDIGSGKTKVATALQAMYGLPDLTFSATRKNEDDFGIFCSKGGIGIIDNVDDAVPWLGNALDVVSTGTGTTRRILYTTGETLTLRPLTAIVLTSADATFAGRSSTADRILSVEFTRIERAAKDSELLEPFKVERDRLMTFIARTIQRALRQPVPADGINRRHPDFGLVAQRLGAAIGWKDVPQILGAAEDRKELLAFENDTKYLGQLYDFMSREKEPWTGDARGLLADMIAAECYSENEQRNVYPAALGKRINKAWHSLVKIFKAERKDMGHRKMIYTFHPPAEPHVAQPANAGAQGTPAPAVPSPAPPQTPTPAPAPASQPSLFEAAPSEPREKRSGADFDLEKFPIQKWTEADRLA